jgi:hypothetical protein
MEDLMLRPNVLVVLALTLVPTTALADHHFGDHHHSGGSSLLGGSGGSSEGSSDDYGGGGCGGADSASSSGSSSSSSSMSAPSASTSSGVHLSVFFTSSTYEGDLGGLAGADAKCALAAKNAGLLGYYRAWISSGQGNALGRPGNGAFYTTKGELAFATRPTSTSVPLVGIADEYGQPAKQPFEGTWSASDTHGLPTGADCNMWTDASDANEATTGSLQAGAATWGGGGVTASCATVHPLLCFQE